jgi:hypothetical protein
MSRVVRETVMIPGVIQEWIYLPKIFVRLAPFSFSHDHISPPLCPLTLADNVNHGILSFEPYNWKINLTKNR